MYRAVTLFLALILAIPAFGGTFVTSSPFSNSFSPFPTTTYVSPPYSTTRTYPRRYRHCHSCCPHNYNRYRRPGRYYASPRRYSPFRRYRNYNSYNTYSMPYTQYQYDYQTSAIPIGMLSGAGAGVNEVNEVNGVNINDTMNNLNLLEEYAFNKTFKRDENLKRLERLEELAFGAVQSGDYDTRYRNVETAILSRPKNNYEKKSLLSSIGDYFSGQLTGFTPSILTQDLTPGFTRNANESFSNGIFGSGYNNFSHNYGSNSGVHILD